MLNGTQVIDADGHLMEPLDLWEKRLPAELREQAPQWGKTGYTFQGMKYPNLGPDYPNELDARVRAHQRATQERLYPEALDSGWSPESTIRSMDRIGIDVSFLYPSRGAVWAIEEMDPVLANALVRIRNDWAAEYVAYEPERLKSVASLTLQDPALAVEELHRVVSKLGARGVHVRPNPMHGRVLGDPAYEELWSECERLNVAVGVHEGGYSLLPAAGAGRFKTRFGLHGASHPLEQMMGFLALLEGGVFQRHPDLRFAFLESGCGWLPFWLFRLDMEHRSLNVEVADLIPEKPSEYFRRQCYISCEPDEPYLPEILDYIGEDRLLFASDYPHPDHGSEPVRKLVELGERMPKRVLRKIFYDNPRAFYGMS